MSRRHALLRLRDRGRSLNDNTLKPAALLEGREDWRFEEFDDEDHWLFGVDSEARLVITPEMEGFRMYRADQDQSWVIPALRLVGVAGVGRLRVLFPAPAGRRGSGPAGVSGEPPSLPQLARLTSAEAFRRGGPTSSTSYTVRLAPSLVS